EWFATISARVDAVCAITSKGFRSPTKAKNLSRSSRGSSAFAVAMAAPSRDLTIFPVAFYSRSNVSHPTRRPGERRPACTGTGGGTMSFGIYMVGFIVLIIGLALGAHLMHMPGRWIGVGVIVLTGLGILLGVTSTRRPDPS